MRSVCPMSSLPVVQTFAGSAAEKRPPRRMGHGHRQIPSEYCLTWAISERNDVFPTPVFPTRGVVYLSTGLDIMFFRLFGSL